MLQKKLENMGDIDSTHLVNSELKERRDASLRHALGDIVLAALADDEVTEIRLNDDGSLWLEKYSGKIRAGEISFNDGMAILMNMASAMDFELTKETPIVEGELPLDGSRFIGFAPPVVVGPVIAIRKKALKIFTLDDYVRNGVIEFKEAEYLRSKILEYKNILVVGSTNSGKTTFCNAISHEISLLLPDDRMTIIQDRSELKCSLADRNFLNESHWTKSLELAQASMRISPGRLCVCELRKGAPAEELIKLWNTGHPGGFTTIHADSAEEALTRLDQLIQEVSLNPQRETIARAVNVCVFLKKQGAVRRVEEIIEVVGFNHAKHRFITRDIFRLYPKKEFLYE